MESDRDTQRMIRLLSVLVALVALLIVGLTIGGVYAYSKYQRAQKAVAQARSGTTVEEALSNASKLATELDSRRDHLSKDLQTQADLTQKRIRELQARRAADAHVEKGMVDKAEQMYRMTQMGIDEGLAALENLAGTQEALARAVAKEEPGTGGSPTKHEGRNVGTGGERKQNPEHGSAKDRSEHWRH